ncbi:hypothetical protein [Amycolatopsis thermophila]|uniref:Uncharacterized protein n=1 Tax=Amycolatopsis thermophila TaxID=206084 RepID=A0ABU0EPZ2_9PSEU|nr:hypothetical protein [Amycolatopsis thermophila]MDQ0377371.1 hypothetical protein [Amycolatopsis thermophila]
MNRGTRRARAATWMADRIRQEETMETPGNCNCGNCCDCGGEYGRN